MDKNAFAGMNGYVWWLGVVEDRHDPLNLCRVRVRIFGWHTDNKQMIPTDHLPWAQPLLPINGSNQSKTPLEGDWVHGFFFDGESGQFPIYSGVLSAIPKPLHEDSQKGFYDPRSASQIASSPAPYKEKPVKYPKNIGEPTTSRLYRNEKIDTTIIGKRKDTLTKDVPTADEKKWDEPKPPYAAKAPYNDVKETESGHVLEFDDTPGAERINLAHRTGTYYEFQPDGTRTTRIVKDNYEIIVGDDYVNIKGVCNITIDKGANLLVGGDITIHGKKDAKVTIDGDADILVKGSVDLNVKGEMNSIISEDMTFTANRFLFYGPIAQMNGNFVNVGHDVIASEISLVNHIHEDDDSISHIVTGPPVS